MNPVHKIGIIFPDPLSCNNLPCSNLISHKYQVWIFGCSSEGARQSPHGSREQEVRHLPLSLSDLIHRCFLPMNVVGNISTLARIIYPTSCQNIFISVYSSKPSRNSKQFKCLLSYINYFSVFLWQAFYKLL